MFCITHRCSAVWWYFIAVWEAIWSKMVLAVGMNFQNYSLLYTNEIFLLYFFKFSYNYTFFVVAFFILWWRSHKWWVSFFGKTLWITIKLLLQKKKKKGCWSLLFARLVTCLPLMENSGLNTIVDFIGKTRSLESAWCSLNKWTHVKLH